MATVLGSKHAYIDRLGTLGSAKAMPTRQITTKDIGLLNQLYREGQLHLAPEFQRNSVWPASAKAYLIDTVLVDRPIPLLFFQKQLSPQTGRPVYAVIDGQQRLRAIFDYLDDRFRLTQSAGRAWAGKSYSDLSAKHREQILGYTFVIEELANYSTKDIQDLFVRINKYVVRLSPQELRHARAEGRFSSFAERIGHWPFWRDFRVFSPSQLARMRAVEFSAELAILLIEGPQDKKTSIDLYYGQYREAFPGEKEVERRLTAYLGWTTRALPDLARRRYRRPVDLYSLVGALQRITSSGIALSRLNAERAGEELRKFESLTRRARPTGDASRYLVAASRQTDNITPRETRIEILEELLRRS
jgi:Protein of unknown function DUF262